MGIKGKFDKKREAFFMLAHHTIDPIAHWYSIKTAKYGVSIEITRYHRRSRVGHVQAETMVAGTGLNTPAELTAELKYRNATIVCRGLPHAVGYACILLLAEESGLVPGTQIMRLSRPVNGMGVIFNVGSTIHVHTAQRR